jgi:hypothetical protein
MHLSWFLDSGKKQIKLSMPLHPEMHTVKSMVDLETARWNKYMYRAFFCSQDNVGNWCISQLGWLGE